MGWYDNETPKFFAAKKALAAEGGTVFERMGVEKVVKSQNRTEPINQATWKAQIKAPRRPV